MERRARAINFFFPFHVSSICGYLVRIAVLDFFPIVHACEETSSNAVIFQCDPSSDDGFTLVGRDGGQIPDKTGYFAVQVK